jgi:hypothetical protein
MVVGRGSAEMIGGSSQRATARNSHVEDVKAELKVLLWKAAEVPERGQ